MDNHADMTPDDTTFWGQHRFLLLIAISIVVALVLVGISMTLYATSGAAQLDLSRPGYRAVSNQAINDNNDLQNYSASGDINNATISEFKSLYGAQATKAKAVDAFSGDPLNPDALEISTPIE
jgi:hypothetical protein